MHESASKYLCGFVFANYELQRSSPGLYQSIILEILVVLTIFGAGGAGGMGGAGGAGGSAGAGSAGGVGGAGGAGGGCLLLALVSKPKFVKKRQRQT